MSVEERLFALAQQIRQQSGDSFLLSSSQLVPRLNSQAPDLHAEIRALAAAFTMGAAARIAASANQDAEANAIASDIAVRERLSMASVAPAIAVARRIGALTGGYAGTPTPGGWAGDSMAVGAAPQAPAYQAPPAYTPPPQAPQQHYPQPQPGYAMGQQPSAQQGESQTDKLKALSKNPLAMGALALVVGFLVYKNFMEQPSPGPAPTPAPISGPGPQPNPQPGPNPNPQPQTGNQQLPALQPPNAGGPTIAVQRHSSGAPGFMFSLQTQRGPAPAMVLLPQGGWQSGAAGFGVADPGDATMQNVASAGQGQFQLVQSDGRPVRLAQIQMQQDNLGVGNVCLMFRGAQGQQDVQLSGADFCLMDGPCSRPIGCAKLQ